MSQLRQALRGKTAVDVGNPALTIYADMSIFSRRYLCKYPNDANLPAFFDKSNSCILHIELSAVVHKAERRTRSCIQYLQYHMMD